MKEAIQKIDRALKTLYNLELPHAAENFLVEKEPKLQSSVRNRDLNGMLLIRELPKGGITLGIYLNEPVREVLSDFPTWEESNWNLRQMNAFTIAAEEVSHFHYLLSRTIQRRPVSQLELEMQGEVDKFLLAFFAEKSAPPKERFEKLLDQFFLHFRLREDLDEEQVERYTQASQVAKRFILQCEAYLTDPVAFQKGLKIIRRFYELGCAEKLSRVAP